MPYNRLCAGTPIHYLDLPTDNVTPIIKSAPRDSMILLDLRRHFSAHTFAFKRAIMLRIRFSYLRALPVPHKLPTVFGNSRTGAAARCCRPENISSSLESPPEPSCTHANTRLRI